MNKVAEMEPPCRDDDSPCSGKGLDVCTDCWKSLGRQDKLEWVRRARARYGEFDTEDQVREVIRSIDAEDNFVREWSDSYGCVTINLRRGKPRTVSERAKELEQEGDLTQKHIPVRV